jgi:hypothetical protein
VNNFEISFSWIAVQSSQSASYSFPELVSKYLRKQYNKPAVYRWLIERNGKSSIYIGETENLGRRLQHYLKPGPSQKTNKRVREFLDTEIVQGACIKFDVLIFESFVINRRVYSPESLWEKEVRCFLENLLITQLTSEVEKLNRVISVQEKAIHRAAKALRPDLNREQLANVTAALFKKMKQSES